MASAPLPSPPDLLAGSPASLWATVHSHARQRPDHPAMVFQGKHISYAALLSASQRLAQQLTARGLGAGDRVALLSANHPTYPELLLAASFLGLTVIPLNTRLGSVDLASSLMRCDPRLVIHGENFRKHDYRQLMKATQERLQEIQGKTCRFDVVSSTELAALVAGDGHAAPPATTAVQSHADHALLIIFTSGSSGFPKPVLIGEGQAVRMMTRYGHRMGLTPQDRALSCMPYFHVYGGVITVLAPLAAGSTIVMLPAFDAEDALRATAQERCTVVFGTAETYRAWLTHPSFGDHDLSSVRTGQWSGGPAGLRLETAQQVNEKICSMHAIFGMTETLGTATMTQADDPFEIAGKTAGRPLPDVDIRVVDRVSRAPLPQGETGLLQVRGDCVALGYFGLPELTAAAIDTDGWLNTGDLAHVDAAGNLCVQGRTDDRLRCGGENIDAQEVERFVEGHAQVGQCQVVGVPDPRLTEIPVAFVIPVPGSKPLDEKALLAHCVGKLADFKIPRRFFIVEEFPGFMHKVQKGKLKEDAIARMAKPPL